MAARCLVRRQVPRSGHQLFIENPDAVNAAILRMCQPRAALYPAAQAHAARRRNAVSAAAAAAALESLPATAGHSGAPVQALK
jgi:hypothetical protein